MAGPSHRIRVVLLTLGSRARRLRALAIAAGCVLAVCCVAAVPAAASHTRYWLVSGSLAGSYSDAVSWVNCRSTGATGTAREKLKLGVRISTPHAAVYEGTGIALALAMRSGGSVNISGSYPPRHVDIDGNETGCSAERSFHCNGSVVSRNNSRITRVQMVFLPRGGAAVKRIQQGGGFFVESMSLRYPDAGSICSPESTAPVLAGPMLGLADTLIEPDALGEDDQRPNDLVKIPRSRLGGTKAFTVKHSAGPDGGCTRRRVDTFYTKCSETGRITLTLHFTPAHGH